MPSIFTLRSSTLRSGADLRADILALTQSPATVTVTPVALGVSAAISLALSPATVTVTAVAPARTLGGATPALSPATITVTAIADGITPGAVSPALSPATIEVTAIAPDFIINDLPIDPDIVLDEDSSLTGGGKWGITRQDREALDRHREGEEHQRMLIRDDEELFAVI